MAIAHHLVERETLAKANTAVILTLVGGGLVACAVGSVVFDLGRLIGTW